MTDMYEKIKALRLKQGISQDELAEKVGYTHRSSIGKVESGLVDLPQSKIKAFADALHTTPQYLMGFSDDEHMYTSAGLDFIRIPLYGPLCCGNGGFVEDNIIEYIPVPSRGLGNPEKYFAQIASGESMKDAGINDGDLLVFEKVPVVPAGTIGCFCTDENEATCKKYKELNGIIMLQPMNSEFDVIIIDPMNSSFRCLGKLKKVIKDIE